jgi:hypothetical protein
MNRSASCVGITVLVVAACSDGPRDASDRTSSVAALVAGRSTFVAVARDARGGAFVHAINEGRVPMYVTQVDLSALDADVERAVRDAPDGEIVLRGAVVDAGAPAFRVDEAYRGMPGATFDERRDAFFVVESDAGEAARFVNRAASIPIGSSTVDRAVLPFVDAAWLASRVDGHGAIVAGWFHIDAGASGAAAFRLDAAQVFVRLPDPIGPCPLASERPIPLCDEPNVLTSKRTADRCLMTGTCIRPGLCPQFIPACADGYTLRSWSSAPSGCNAFACDPSFLAAP